MITSAADWIMSGNWNQNCERSTGPSMIGNCHFRGKPEATTRIPMLSFFNCVIYLLFGILVAGSLLPLSSHPHWFIRG